MRVPIRARVTAAFATVMLVLLAGIALLAYATMSAALQDEIDSGLRFRAVSALDNLDAIPRPDAALQERAEAFVQVLARDGRVVRATPGFATPALRAGEIARVRRPTFFDRVVRPVPGSARLLAVPAPGGVLVVGASTNDRRDALAALLGVLVLGGTVAVALASLAGWVVAGWALRPVERMRAQASAITVSGLDHRLTLPRSRDELQRLAATLNGMLDGLAGSLARERAFLERASHELRTPLAALRAEVDLALRRERSAAELTDALRSVSAETDRLARLAEDLLVLARAGDGRLPLHREPVALRAALESAVALFTARAAEHGVRLEVDAPDLAIRVDAARLRQALVNLLDNALRHSPRGAAVHVAGYAVDGTARIGVADEGAGIGPGVAYTGGLGLRIVAAVAAAHGGTVRIGNAPQGGALVEMQLPIDEEDQ